MQKQNHLRLLRLVCQSSNAKKSAQGKCISIFLTLEGNLLVCALFCQQKLSSVYLMNLNNSSQYQMIYEYQTVRPYTSLKCDYINEDEVFMARSIISCSTFLGNSTSRKSQCPLNRTQLLLCQQLITERTRCIFLLTTVT